MKKIIILVIVCVFIGIVFIGCGEVAPTVEDQQSQATDQLMTEANNQIGMPEISHFYEKKLLKDLYELRDDSDLVCYAYTTNLEGQYIYLGRCIGYGLPYAVQFSNPEKLVRADLGEYVGEAEMPQAEPNGLFMPDALSATWLIMINEETGEREPMYCEPQIVVTQSKLPVRLCAEWSLPEGY